MLSFAEAVKSKGNGGINGGAVQMVLSELAEGAIIQTKISRRLFQINTVKVVKLASLGKLVKRRIDS